MRIPGGNILSLALTLIGKTDFIYYAYLSRTLNDIGQYVPLWAAGVKASGSVQPVPRTLYENLGLDLQKNYFNFFVPRDIYDVGRNISGDQFRFDGRVFQCVSKTPWYALDGWDSVLCVEVPGEGDALVR